MTALITLAVSGYRSLRQVVLPLAPLTVITGANGTGKSSLYRSLRLLGDIAQGRAAASIAAEGGLASTLWAGPETVSRGMRSGETAITGTVRRKPVTLRLGFAAQDYGYAVDLGLPAHVTAFADDPEIKAEAVWVGEALRRANVIAERSGPSVRVRSDTGAWTQVSTTLPHFDSMMTHAADPLRAPELLLLRDRMRNWRFYDMLRTDRDAPARQPQVGTLTPVLAGSGADLAAAIQTILEIGDAPGFHAAVQDAFPGSEVEISNSDGMFRVQMTQRGLLRPLSGAEMSDGTLRYLLLAAALLSPRPPGLMVLNEPETSLHPTLIAPLVRLIQRVAQECQIIVVSHSTELASALQAHGALMHHLQKDTGETHVPDAEPVSWNWPKR